MDFLVFQYPMITIQACLDGLLLGVLFALIAYGMALQWGVMNIINIAQGDLVILGGYIAYFMYLYGIHPAWGVIVSPIICLLYTSPSPRDKRQSRMPSSA